MICRVTYDSQERREKQVLDALNAIGIESVEEAVKKFTGSYGRTTAEQGVVKAIDPRKE